MRFSSLGGDLDRRAVFYLATRQPPDDTERLGLLNFELSDALTQGAVAASAP